MMIPSRRNFFDEVFDEPIFSKKEAKMMKTDIKEKDGNYIFTIDVPGFEKENINIELDGGYLTVSATMNKNVDDEEKDGKYIYKERYSGECSRSFYVGDIDKEKIAECAEIIDQLIRAMSRAYVLWHTQNKVKLTDLIRSKVKERATEQEFAEENFESEN